MDASQGQSSDATRSAYLRPNRHEGNNTLSNDEGWSHDKGNGHVIRGGVKLDEEMAT